MEIKKEDKRSLIKDQVLKRGFASFEKLDYKFDKQQVELLESYLDGLLNESIFKVENIFEITGETPEQTKELLGIILDLAAIGFVNWGTTLYYREILSTINKGYDQWAKENGKEE